MRKVTKGTIKNFNQIKADKIFYRSVFFCIGLAVVGVIVAIY